MRRLTLFAVAVLAAATTLAAAQDPKLAGDHAAEIVGVRVGFAGHYKPGLWTPVEVLVRGGGTTNYGLALTAPDGDGVPCRILANPEQPSPTGPGGEMELMGYVRFGRVESSLLVELCEGDRVVARKSFEAGAVGPESEFPKALPSSERLFVVVGHESLGVDEAVAGFYRTAGDHATVAVVGDDFRRMPTRWFGYEAVEAVFLPTGREELYRSLTPGSPQGTAQIMTRIGALGEWVGMGGTVVTSVGRHAADLLPLGDPLFRLAPGKFQRLFPLRQANALESYCTGGAAISPLLAAQHELPAAQLTGVRGAVEVREGKDLPLVIRDVRGFGQVVFAAVDLDLPPASQWPGRPLLVRRLLDLGEATAIEAPQSSTVMHFGFDDMAGQLRSALDQFTGVPPISFWIIVAVFLGYLVLIGPVDYLLLRKVLRRMELTWITFPPMVVAACVAAYFAAHRLKGDTLRVNEAVLVDVDCQSGRLRGTAWATLFSPQTQPYDISLQPRTPNILTLSDSRNFDPTRGVPINNAALGLPVNGVADETLLVSWFGLPGSGLGGMAPKTANPVALNQPYAISPALDRLVGLPIQVWSTKSLCARWGDLVRPHVEAGLTEQSFTPVGTVTNRLDFPLKDCMLVYGRWVYELGTLEPGEAVTITSTQGRRDLRSFLFGRGVLTEGNDKASSRYDQSSVDLRGILRTMTFFDAAGGLRHTGLANHYQAFVDLSGLLRANRAVLLAEAPPDSGSSDPLRSGSSLRGAEVLSSGQPVAGLQDRRVTIYRFILPVGRTP